MKWRWLRTCLGGDPQPTRFELRKIESKLISMIERPTSSCGLHVAYLMSAFKAVSGDWSTQDVLQHIVKPQTAFWRCRYVDIISTEYVGEANYFVSHNLQAPFQQLVQAIRSHFYTPDGEERPEASEAFLWLDLFAVNHHCLGFKEEYTQLPQIISSCRSMLLVLDGRCSALSKLLVLYEVWATMHAAQEKKDKMPTLEVLATCVDPRYLRNQMLSLDVRHGSVNRDYDRNWVLDQLMSRGVQRVNSMIRKALADSARRLASRLWEQHKSCTGGTEDPASLIHDLHVCAFMIQLHGRYNEAVGVYRYALEVWEQQRDVLLGENPLPLLIHYTELLLLLKLWEEAFHMAREALQLSQSELGLQPAERQGATPFSMSGERYSSQAYSTDMGPSTAGRVPEPLGLHSSPVLPCTILLARALLGLGQGEQAERLMRTAYEQQRRHVLPGLRHKERFRQLRRARSMDVARAALALADILRLKEGGASEAVKLCFQAQHGLIKALGETHTDVAYVQMRIGQLMRGQGKLDHAQRMLLSTLAVYSRSWGEEHPETASAMVYLADAELATLHTRDLEFTDAELQSALQKATRQFMQAYKIRKLCLGLNHVDTLATLVNAVVQLLNSSNTRVQLARAEPMCGLVVKSCMAMQVDSAGLQADLPTCLETSRKQVSNLVSCLQLMGMVLSTAGKAKEAMHVLDEGRTIAEHELPANHQLEAQCLLGMADLQQVQRDWVLAEATYRKALAIYNTLLEHASYVPLAAATAQPSSRGMGRLSVGLARGLRHLSLSSDTRQAAAPEGAAQLRTATWADQMSMATFNMRGSNLGVEALEALGSGSYSQAPPSSARGMASGGPRLTSAGGSVGNGFFSVPGSRSVLVERRKSLDAAAGSAAADMGRLGTESVCVAGPAGGHGGSRVLFRPFSRGPGSALPHNAFAQLSVVQEAVGDAGASVYGQPSHNMLNPEGLRQSSLSSTHSGGGGSASITPPCRSSKLVQHRSSTAPGGGADAATDAAPAGSPAAGAAVLTHASAFCSADINNLAHAAMLNVGAALLDLGSIQVSSPSAPRHSPAAVAQGTGAAAATAEAKRAESSRGPAPGPGLKRVARAVAEGMEEISPVADAGTSAPGSGTTAQGRSWDGRSVGSGAGAGVGGGLAPPASSMSHISEISMVEEHWYTGSHATQAGSSAVLDDGRHHPGPTNAHASSAVLEGPSLSSLSYSSRQFQLATASPMPAGSSSFTAGSAAAAGPFLAPQQQQQAAASSSGVSRPLSRFHEPAAAKARQGAAATATSGPLGGSGVSGNLAALLGTAGKLSERLPLLPGGAPAVSSGLLQQREMSGLEGPALGNTGGGAAPSTSLSGPLPMPPLPATVSTSLPSSPAASAWAGGTAGGGATAGLPPLSSGQAGGKSVLLRMAASQYLLQGSGAAAAAATALALAPAASAPVPEVARAGSMRSAAGPSSAQLGGSGSVFGGAARSVAFATSSAAAMGLAGRSWLSGDVSTFGGGAGKGLVFSQGSGPVPGSDVVSPEPFVAFGTDGNQRGRRAHEGPETAAGVKSALGRVVKQATAKLAATLSRAEVSMAAESLAAASVAGTVADRPGLMERMVQLPKLTDMRASPHQLILKMRSQLAKRPQALLQLEAAVVANNLGLLLRWTASLHEAEGQLRMALHWSSLTAPPLLRNLSKSHTVVGPPTAPDVMAANSNINVNVAGGAQPDGDALQQLAAAAAMGVANETLLIAGLAALGGLPQGGGSAGPAGLLPAGADPHVLHARALMMSNLGTVLAAAGRFRDAEDLMRLGMRICQHVSRLTDAFIIALNLVQLYCSTGNDAQALELAKTVVSPHLGVMLGPNASARLGGSLQTGTTMQQAVAAAQGTALPAPTAAATATTSAIGSFDLQRQIVEALSVRMVDDGGQMLYEWAAEALALHDTALAVPPAALPALRSAPVQLPQTVFVLQVPGIHFKCLHMVRWLLVVKPAFVQPGAGGGVASGWAARRPAVFSPFNTHIASGTSSFALLHPAPPMSVGGAATAGPISMFGTFTSNPFGYSSSTATSTTNVWGAGGSAMALGAGWGAAGEGSAAGGSLAMGGKPLLAPLGRVR